MSDDPGSLARLHDLALPPEAGVWPLAPGAWILALAAAALLATFAFHAFARYRANAYRREAERELDAIAAASHPAGEIVAISTLLKRVATVAFPRERVASLSGLPWAGFLCETAAPGFEGHAVRSLLGDAFRAGSPKPDDLRSLVSEARAWIRDHRGPGEAAGA